MGTELSYPLRLDADELARYRMMAARARRHEAELWQKAGLVRDARVVDVGCGPGAMLVSLAEVVGAGGSVVGVDSDPEAVEAARAAIVAAGVANAEVRPGRAERTGLPEGSFDVAVLRNVLAHNGGAEQRIVNHLARLVRPGGYVYLFDIDAAFAGMVPSHPDLEDLLDRYHHWHMARGNDLRVGRSLRRLGQVAGLTVEVFRGWFEVGDLPVGMRGPAWAARHTLVTDGLADWTDLARWSEAFEQIDTWAERPQGMMATFAAVCLRPSDSR